MSQIWTRSFHYSVTLCVVLGCVVFFSFDPKAAHCRAAPRRLPSLPQEGCVLQSHPVQDGLPEMDRGAAQHCRAEMLLRYKLIIEHHHFTAAERSRDFNCCCLLPPGVPLVGNLRTRLLALHVLEAVLPSCESNMEEDQITQVHACSCCARVYSRRSVGGQ